MTTNRRCKDCPHDGITTTRPLLDGYPGPAEQWLPVPGYEGLYEVSNHGRVRSLDRLVTGSDRTGTRRQRVQPGRIMRQTPCAFGYRRVELRGFEGRSSRRNFAVHRLVLEAFVGPPPTHKHEVRHYPDPDPANNHLTNLRWGTHAENVRDTIDAGRFVNSHRNKKTCPAGHMYSGRDSRGTRICHTCRREQRRRARRSA